MSGGQTDPLRRLFDACITAPAEERKRLLAAAHTADPEMAREVEALLRHHDAADAMLDRPPAAVSAGASGSAPDVRTPPGTLPAGTRVGRYVIRSLLGYGGMGVVYEAEQESPRRLVALKLIRSELVTRSLLRRFEHEAAALGLLQHPGIAQVYEAGSADVAGAARPFIAMELIRGEPVTEFVRRGAVDVRRVTELIVQIADAVDHAHRRGVIHRDLKPANIVVTQDGQPKVLDFGVARLAAADDGEQGATLAGQIIGTLGYLAPEQALGDPSRVDARCDVYALGVVAYELLTGRHPTPDAASSLRDAVTSLERPVIQRPGAFAPAVRGDLETVILHALEHDPARRYQHAADFAADLRRFLASEPILARPASTVYQLRMFAARNRLAVAAAIVVLIAVAIGMAGLGMGLIRARQQAERAQRVNLYLRSMLSLDAQQLAGRDRSLLKAMLDQAVAKLGRLDDDPAAQDAILAVVGNAYAEFGYPVEAIEILPEVVDRQRRRLGERHEDSMFAADALAHALLVGGEFARALPVLESLYSARLATSGAGAGATETTLNNLILVLRAVGRTGRALELAEQELARREAAYGANHEQTLHARMVVGGLLADAGRMDEAGPLLLSVRDGFVRLRGDRDAQSVIAGISWCEFLKKAGRNDEYMAAAALLWPVAIEVMGENYNPALGLMQQLATSLVEQDRAAEAGPVFERVLAIQPKAYPDHPNTLALLANAAMYFSSNGDYRRAADLGDQAVAACRRIRPDAPGLLAELLRRTGTYQLQSGNAVKARETLLDSYRIAESLDPSEPDLVASVRSALAEACESLGRMQEAAEWRSGDGADAP